MNHTRPMFKQTSDGFACSPAGVLLLAAGCLYGDPTETTLEGRKNATKIIDGIVNAAYLGGFFQGDVLHTLLARNRPDARTKAMAQAACDAAGNEALIRIISGVMEE